MQPIIRPLVFCWLLLLLIHRKLAFCDTSVAVTSPEVLLDTANKWRLTAQQAAAIGRPEEAGKIRICTSPWTPNVICDPKQSDDSYTGFEVEVFKEIARRALWLSNSSAWFFDCMDWTPMHEDLAADNGSCMMAPAGVQANQANMQMGIKLSWITSKEGMRILTLKTSPKLNVWTPFTVFSWELWLLLLCTSGLVGFALWVVDTRARALLNPPLTQHKCRRQPSGSLRRLLSVKSSGRLRHIHTLRLPVTEPCKSTKDVAEECQQHCSMAEQDQGASQENATGLLRWLGVKRGEERDAMKLLRRTISQACLKMPDMGEPPAVRSLPAQIVLFAYGLLLLIIVALYTASAAAQLTARQLQSDIQGIDDLRGKAVATWTDYVDKLAQLGLATIGLSWETDADEKLMLDIVRSGQTKALVIDSIFAVYTAAQYCEFALVGEPFSMIDTGIGYSKRLDRALQEDMDRHIAGAIEDGLVERLYDIHVKKLGGRCAEQNLDTDSMASQIGLEQVAGLWVLLALSIAASLVVLLVYWVQRYRQYAHQLVVKSFKSSSSGSSGLNSCRVSRENPSSQTQQECVAASGAAAAEPADPSAGCELVKK